MMGIRGAMLALCGLPLHPTRPPTLVVLLVQLTLLRIKTIIFVSLQHVTVPLQLLPIRCLCL